MPSDYGTFYFAPAGLMAAGTVFTLPRTDYVPIKGIHSSLATCVGLPGVTTENGLLGTKDTINQRTVKLAQCTDGLSKTILLVEHKMDVVRSLADGATRRLSTGKELVNIVSPPSWQPS